jgi:hypothetical protein
MTAQVPAASSRWAVIRKPPQSRHSEREVILAASPQRAVIDMGMDPS